MVRHLKFFGIYILTKTQHKQQILSPRQTTIQTIIQTIIPIPFRTHERLLSFLCVRSTKRKQHILSLQHNSVSLPLSPQQTTHHDAMPNPI